MMHALRTGALIVVFPHSAMCPGRMCTPFMRSYCVAWWSPQGSHWTLRQAGLSKKAWVWLTCGDLIEIVTLHVAISWSLLPHYVFSMSTELTCLVPLMTLWMIWINRKCAWNWGHWDGQPSVPSRGSAWQIRSLEPGLADSRPEKARSVDGPCLRFMSRTLPRSSIFNYIRCRRRVSPVIHRTPDLSRPSPRSAAW